MGKHDKAGRALTNRRDKKLGPSTFKMSYFKLSDSVKAKITSGQAEALTRWDLDFCPEPKSDAPRTGGKVLNDKTIVAYEFHLKNVEKFCWLIGDYDSSIILNLNCPAFSPSMSVRDNCLVPKVQVSPDNSCLEGFKWQRCQRCRWSCH
jgi:hypothetical protein